MKYTLQEIGRAAFIVLMVFLAMWFSISFVSLKVNMLEWKDDWRAIYLLLSSMVSAISVGLYLESVNKKKKGGES